VQDEVNQEDSEQNEVDGMKKGADTVTAVMFPRCEVMGVSGNEPPHLLVLTAPSTPQPSPGEPDFE